MKTRAIDGRLGNPLAYEEMCTTSLKKPTGVTCTKYKTKLVHVPSTMLLIALTIVSRRARNAVLAIADDRWHLREGIRMAD